MNMAAQTNTACGLHVCTCPCTHSTSTAGVWFIQQVPLSVSDLAHLQRSAELLGQFQFVFRQLWPEEVGAHSSMAAGQSCIHICRQGLRGTQRPASSNAQHSISHRVTAQHRKQAGSSVKAKKRSGLSWHVVVLWGFVKATGSGPQDVKGMHRCAIVSTSAAVT